MGNCLTSKPFAVHPTVVPTDVAPGRGGYRVKVRMTAGEFKELTRRTAREGVMLGDGGAGDQMLGRAVVEGCREGRWQAVSVGTAAEVDHRAEVDCGVRAAAAGSSSSTPALATITEED